MKNKPGCLYEATLHRIIMCRFCHTSDWETPVLGKNPLNSNFIFCSTWLKMNRIFSYCMHLNAPKIHSRVHILSPDYLCNRAHPNVCYELWTNFSLYNNHYTILFSCQHVVKLFKERRPLIHSSFFEILVLVWIILFNNQHQ